MCSHAHVHACAQMVENVTFYTVHTRTCAKRTKESEPLKTCVRGTGKTSEKRAKQLIFTNDGFCPMAFSNRKTILQKPDSINVLLRIPNRHGQYKLGSPAISWG